MSGFFVWEGGTRRTIPHKRAAAVWLSAWLILAVCAQSAPAGAQRSKSVQRQVAVEVVDVAGGRAYLTPGEDAGLRRGDTVVLGERRAKLVATSASHAVLELRGRGIKPGARGHALISPNPQSGPKRLPTPHPLDAWRSQWPKPRLPSSLQRVKPVPLGPTRAQSPLELALSLNGAAIVPLGGSAAAVERAELRARVRAQPWLQTPMRVDADVAAALFAPGDDTRPGARSRPPLAVRSLQLAYGQERSWLGAIGRLRYASRTLGMLDGAKLQAPIDGGVTLGAFGGVVPDPISGKPQTQAARFGGEVAWEDLTLGVRPRAALGVEASHFDGRIDERRLNAVVETFPGKSRFGGYAQLSLYDRDNPWHAPKRELSAAGFDARVNLGEVDVGGRLDLQRPERSAWLASYLPTGFFCTTRSANPSLPGEPCNGNDARYLAEADVTLHRPNFSLSLGATGSSTEHADADEVGGLLRASLLRVFEQVRLDAALMGSSGSLYRSVAASLGLGSAFAHGLLDVSLRYRPALSRYAADTGTFLEHAFGASVLLLPTTDFDVDLEADAITGRDVDVLLVQTLLSWRPRL